MAAGQEETVELPFLGDVPAQRSLEAGIAAKRGVGLPCLGVGPEDPPDDGDVAHDRHQPPRIEPAAGHHELVGHCGPTFGRGKDHGVAPDTRVLQLTATSVGSKSRAGRGRRTVAMGDSGRNLPTEPGSGPFPSPPLGTPVPRPPTMVAKAMAPVVQFRAAVALAGRFPALAGVDLSVETGEVVLVLGANGAGKTSLLRACAGLLPVTSGEARVLGVDLTADHTAVRRHVGLLGHAAPLYDELSAAENVRFAVRALGLPTATGEAALDRLGLVGRLRTTPAGRLSAGQRRRVALAALVARRPALWLLDEPHAGLDAPARALLGDLIAKPWPMGQRCCSPRTSPSWPSRSRTGWS